MLEQPSHKCVTNCLQRRNRSEGVDRGRGGGGENNFTMLPVPYYSAYIACGI